MTEITLFHMQPKNLKKLKTIEQLIIDFIDNGYQISNLKSYYGSSYRDYDAFGNDIDATLLSLAKNKKFGFKLTNNETELEFLASISWKDMANGDLIFSRPYIYLSSWQDVLFFKGQPYLGNSTYFYFNEVIKLGKIIYAHMSPVFGWIDFSLPEKAPFGNQIDSLSLSEIYWVNFFSPEYVAKIGQEKFDSLVYGYIEDLSDGGIMYVLDKNLFGVKTSEVARQRVLRHLFSTDVM